MSLTKIEELSDLAICVKEGRSVFSGDASEQMTAEKAMGLPGDALLRWFENGMYLVPATDLLPCPCCGASVVITNPDNDEGVLRRFILCDTCGLRLDSLDADEALSTSADLRTLWNNRTPCSVHAGNAATAAEVDAFRRDRDKWKEACAHREDDLERQGKRADAAETELKRLAESLMAVRADLQARLDRASLRLLAGIQFIENTALYLNHERAKVLQNLRGAL